MIRTATNQDRGQAFPEKQRIALDERLRRRRDKFPVGMTKVEDELGQLVIALIRIRMHGFLQRAVDPCRELAAVAQGRFVS